MSRAEQFGRYPSPSARQRRTPRCRVADLATRGTPIAHRNLELLKKIDAAFGAGNPEEIFSFFTDDVVAHISGKSSMAGEHKGKQTLMALFGRYMAALGPNPIVETHAQLADDDHGVQLQRLRAEKGSRKLDVKNITIYHFRDGKVSEMWSVDDDPQAADPFYDA